MSIQFDSPLTAFMHWESTISDQVFLRQPFGGKIKERTYQEAGEEVRRMASAIAALNVPKKSKIAILSKNCAEWILADLAIMMSGHLSVPIYPSIGPETIRLVLEHSEAVAIFVGKLDNYEEQKAGIPDIIKIGIEAYGIKEDYSWEKLIKANDPIRDIPEENLEELLTIMYTSGTTGKPKGVMHSIKNVSGTVNVALQVIPMPNRPRFFSYLPLSHVAERIAVEMHGIYRGSIFSFPESLDTFAGDLEEAKPHLFFAVPRIWSKFQEKILEKMPQAKTQQVAQHTISGRYSKKENCKKAGIVRSHFSRFRGCANCRKLTRVVYKTWIDHSSVLRNDRRLHPVTL